MDAFQMDGLDQSHEPFSQVEIGDVGDDLNSTSKYPTLTSHGILRCKVVEARNIGLSRNMIHPYCVVEYEKNEFVTREAYYEDMDVDVLNEMLVPEEKTWSVSGNSNAAPKAVWSKDATSLRSTSQIPAMSPIPFPTEDHLLWNHEATFDVAQPGGEVVISVWDRPHEDGASETFVGMVRIQLPKPGDSLDGWYSLQRRVQDDNWTGEVRVQLYYRPTQHPEAVSAKDFDLLKVVGKGSFGKVLQVRKKDTGRIYAMKILQKKDIVERQEVAHTLSERNVLIQASSPFLVGLKFSFQTPDKLYLVLDYMNGGELFYQLQKETAFSEVRAKFYTAELVLALEHLHKYNIVYRDLKPENILLDGNGHIALTDFGLCKENVAFDETTNTFCGTAEYLAPEVLTGQGYGKPVDWWSLGILLYEMTAGLPPFYSENTNVMYKKILHNQLTFPPGFSPDAQSLIRGLLTRDPKKRLGGGVEDAAEIKRHPFFADIDWEKLHHKQVQPPYKPKVTSETDVSNFDPAFTEGIPVESLPSKSAPLSEHLQDHFKGFSYVGESVLGQSPAPASNHPLSHRMGNHTLHALTPMTPLSNTPKRKDSIDLDDLDY